MNKWDEVQGPIITGRKEIPVVPDVRACDISGIRAGFGDICTGMSDIEVFMFYHISRALQSYYHNNRTPDKAYTDLLVFLLSLTKTKEEAQDDKKEGLLKTLTDIQNGFKK